MYVSSMRKWYYNIKSENVRIQTMEVLNNRLTKQVLMS